MAFDRRRLKDDYSYFPGDYTKLISENLWQWTGRRLKSKNKTKAIYWQRSTLACQPDSQSVSWLTKQILLTTTNHPSYQPTCILTDKLPIQTTSQPTIAKSANQLTNHLNIVPLAPWQGPLPWGSPAASSCIFCMKISPKMLG